MNHAQVMALSHNFPMDMTFVNGCKICIQNGAFLMLSVLSEINYAEKRLGIPTKCYFQLQSRREFGFM